MATIRTMNKRRKRAARRRPITDCGSDGCGNCDVCRYLDFLEWCGQVAPAGSSIERNPRVEKHLDASHPGWRSA